MRNVAKRIERLLEDLSQHVDTWSLRWRTHANRRTILVTVFAGVLALTLYVSVIQPPRSFPTDTLVTIPEGTSLQEASLKLQEERVIRSAASFKWLMRLTRQEGNVHAGDYLFKKPANLFSVARAVAGGYFGLEPLRIRVPEGSTAAEMAKIFSEQLERFDQKRFLENAPASEGFLFPDTYFFMPNTTDEQILATMRQNFDAHIRPISQEIIAFGRPLREVVTMASLLEREATDMEDRRKIAGVLWNRLDRGMLLQVDAAFLYSIGRATFDLTMTDLTNEDDPYNTYVHKGLPPGPIGSPSIDSLLAAVTPAKHEYLYYLADDEYVTHYSATYEEHLVKKKKYLGS